MPDPRKEFLVNGEIYHIFNKSIGEFEIFTSKRELVRAINLIDYYRIDQQIKYSKYQSLPKALIEQFNISIRALPQLVEIYAFSFMPNHYHLLLKQLQINGISQFISIVQNSFAKYFNKRHTRMGGLFIRPFKSKRITSNEILLHVSRYIHLNLVSSYLSDYENSKFDIRSSYPIYLGNREGNIVNTKVILDIIGTLTNYERFVRDQVDYQKKLQLIKNYIFE